MTAAARLLGAAELRRLAAELDLRPTKTLGQNFVHDANTVRRIVATAQLRPDDHVLEIGPGLGSLTLGLLEATAAVTAVEIDPRLAEMLPRTVAARAPQLADRLRVINANALDVDAADLTGQQPADPVTDRTADGPAAGPPTALVANLPYNVSVPVLLHLLEELPTIRRVLVMVQSEVADRLAAGPGSRTYGAPSVKAAWYGTVRRAGSVGRTIFWPVPGVDSALVSLDRHDVPTADRASVFAVVDAAFSQRRKTLRSALAGWAGSPGAAEAILIRAGIDPQRRGETVDVAGYVAIAAAASEVVVGDSA